MLILALAAGVQGQTYSTVDGLTAVSTTPKFVPVHAKPGGKVAVALPFPAPNYPAPRRVMSPILPPGQVPNVPLKRTTGTTEEDNEPLSRVDLPGPQRFFRRESEQQFFERIAQDAKKKPGSPRTIFPDEPTISKEVLTELPAIRYDLVRRQPFPRMIELVEPGYVRHRRILFEQPNFERAGYDFGVIQPAICVGVYFYDLALLPYHACSDLRNPWDTDVGKCLPGDPAPFVIPRERFSVTGLVGQTSVIMGGLYLFP